MINDIIDLRSDTVTRPDTEMRAAMAAAKVGDDVYREDPTVIELEKESALLTGKEAALLVTSGTQGNLVALLSHCARGDGAILGRDSHIYQYEGGGLAALGGIVPLPVDDAKAIPATAEIVSLCRPPDPHLVPAKLLCLENTHNRCGGLAVPPDYYSEVVHAARQQELKIHLDGARIFNAACKWQVDVRVYTELADSVQFCLSKGLGAPIGSVVCGNSEFIEQCRFWRKRLGGGMRQAGIIAAAGRIALREARQHLLRDHEAACRLRETLAQAAIQVEYSHWSTNMVFFSAPAHLSAPEFCECCRQQNLLLGAMTETRVRTVVHRDVDNPAIERAAEIIIAAYKGE